MAGRRGALASVRRGAGRLAALALVLVLLATTASCQQPAVGRGGGGGSGLVRAGGVLGTGARRGPELQQRQPPRQRQLPGAGESPARILSALNEDTLLVTLLDGQVIAVDRHDGNLLWSFDSGAPLVSAKQSPQGSGFNVFPGADGGLYAYHGASQASGPGLERLPLSLPELVQAAPSLTADGSLILGRRESRVFVLDRHTGQQLAVLTADSDTDQAAQLAWAGLGESQDSLLLVGRQDFVVRSLRVDTQAETWNATFGRMQLLRPGASGGLQAFLAGGYSAGGAAAARLPARPGSGRDSDKLVVGADNTLQAFDGTTGFRKWSVEFGTPPIAAFTPGSEGTSNLLEPAGDGDSPAVPYGPYRKPAGTAAKIKGSLSGGTSVLIGALRGSLYALPADNLMLNAATQPLSALPDSAAARVTRCEADCSAGCPVGPQPLPQIGGGSSGAAGGPTAVLEDAGGECRAEGDGDGGGALAVRDDDGAAGGLVPLRPTGEGVAEELEGLVCPHLPLGLYQLSRPEEGRPALPWLPHAAQEPGKATWRAWLTAQAVPLLLAVLSGVLLIAVMRLGWLLNSQPAVSATQVTGSSAAVVATAAAAAAVDSHVAPATPAAAAQSKATPSKGKKNKAAGKTAVKLAAAAAPPVSIAKQQLNGMRGEQPAAATAAASSATGAAPQAASGPAEAAAAEQRGEVGHAAEPRQQPQGQQKSGGGSKAAASDGGGRQQQQGQPAGDGESEQQQRQQQQQEEKEMEQQQGSGQQQQGEQQGQQQQQQQQRDGSDLGAARRPSGDTTGLSSDAPTSRSYVDETGAVVIGRLRVGPGVLGYGSAGTIVYEGVLDGRPVAVKRLLRQFYDLARKEIQVLIVSDEHPNVVRCFAMEEDREFVYLALERCRCTLSDWVASAEGQAALAGPRGIGSSPQAMALLSDVAAGLAALHARAIVHRDLKPHNVLITDSCRAKLSDMGLSKQLVAEQSSFESHGAGGSSGWQAPEQLIARSGGSVRQTRSMDIFSLGCVVHYCLTGGQHPFGGGFERDTNIMRGQPNLAALASSPEAVNLVAAMLSKSPTARPTMAGVLSHPFWWSVEQRLQFLVDVSDRVEFEDREPDQTLLSALESFRGAAFGGVASSYWAAAVEPELIVNLGKYRRYDYTSLRDLLRVVRNKKNHFREMPEALQRAMGPVPEGYYRYFSSRFPDLLMAVFVFAATHLGADPHLAKYWPEGVACLAPFCKRLQGGGKAGAAPRGPGQQQQQPPPTSQLQRNEGSGGGARRATDGAASRLALATGKPPVPLPGGPSRQQQQQQQQASAPPGSGDGAGSAANGSTVTNGLGGSGDVAAAGTAKVGAEAEAGRASSSGGNGVSGGGGDGGASGFAAAAASYAGVVAHAAAPATPLARGADPAASAAVGASAAQQGPAAAAATPGQSVPAASPSPAPPPASPSPSQGGATPTAPRPPPQGVVVGYEIDGGEEPLHYPPLPRRPGAATCEFYVKTGTCGYGANCRNDHPEEFAVPLTEMQLPFRPHEPLCKFYLKNNECKFGATCKFHHPRLRKIHAGSALPSAAPPSPPPPLQLGS